MHETCSLALFFKRIQFELAICCIVNIKWLNTIKQFEIARNELQSIDKWL